MLRTFIFNEENRWIEEEQILLLHDICAIINSNEMIIYIWTGPEIKKNKLKKAKEKLFKIISNYSEETWKIYEKEKDFPILVKTKIDSMLQITKENKEMGKLKYSRFSTIKLSFIFLIITSILTFISIFLILSLFFTPSIGDTYFISSSSYFLYLNIYRILTITTLIIFTLNSIISAFERDPGIFIFSLLGLIIDIGILVYINQGIFLFIHLEGSTEELFLILKTDFDIFIILNLIELLIVIVPNLYKLYNFYKTYKRYIFISK